MNTLGIVGTLFLILCTGPAMHVLGEGGGCDCSGLREEFEEFKHDVEMLMTATSAYMNQHSWPSIEIPHLKTPKENGHFFDALVVASTASQRETIRFMVESKEGNVLDAWNNLDYIGQRICSAFFIVRKAGKIIVPSSQSVDH